MNITYYKIGEQIYPSQYQVAYVIGMNLGTMRSKLMRAGGTKTLTHIELNGFKVEIINQSISELYS